MKMTMASRQNAFKLKIFKNMYLKSGGGGGTNL